MRQGISLNTISLKMSIFTEYITFSIGSNAPSQFADHFVQQQMFQQQQFQMQQQEV